MCNHNCLMFDLLTISKEVVTGKKILEIGSRDVNGSIRPLIDSWEPEQYIGIDIQKGPGVDRVCDANNIVSIFGANAFDIIFAHEVLEHIRDWKTAVSNMKNVLKPGGLLLLTTRSYGFPYHGFPSDFWRFEVEDMKVIFSDFEINKVEKERGLPGVLIAAFKPANFVEKGLNDIKVYSIITDHPEKEITDEMIKRFERQFYRICILKDIAIKFSENLYKISK